VDEVRESSGSEQPSGERRIGELARLFLKLGLVGFGGPAAHIAMMEDEVVRRRGWLTPGEFLDLVGATNLIPGPNSTEMAIHVGRRMAGWAGLLVAGVCFIVPAMLLTLAAAWAYVRFGALPEVEGVLYGIKPVVIAIVVQALWRLGTAAVRTAAIGLLAMVAAAADIGGVNQVAIILAGGTVMLVARAAGSGGIGAIAAAVPGALAPIATTTATGAAPFSLNALFWFFAKVGSVLFGSGYVLLAFMQTDLVDRYRWLTQTELLDAVAVGQFTPGPVFTTATFVGYVVGATPGALAATGGIFAPAFVFVALSAPVIPRLRRSHLAAGFLDGVNAASLALMAVVSVELGRAALIDGPTVALALVSAALLIRYRVNPAWLVLGGAAAGLGVTALGWR
jgi:chromate transporter